MPSTTSDDLRLRTQASIGSLQMVAVAATTSTVRDEGSQRSWTVRLEPYSLASAPVTQALWDEVSGQSSSSPPNLPVVDVSWNQAVRFCNRLSERESLQPCYRIKGEADDVTFVEGAQGYRLPSEAEWEHACRAGSTASRYGDLDEIAWHMGNSEERLHSVMTRVPNSFGLFDTIGNVWEWCWDLYDGTKYGRYRVFRGGGFADPPRGCRVVSAEEPPNLRHRRPRLSARSLPLKHVGGGR